MHRALFVAEIAEEIAKACLWGNYDLESNLQDGEGRAALFALARTCHALAEPALDALWSFQHGFANLIRTMPSDLWQDEEAQHSTIDCNADTQQWSTTQLSFSGIPTAADWTRFDYYARKIRVFEYDEALCWEDVALSVYHALGVHLRSLSSPLFPGLVSLRWEADTFFPHVSLLLSPSIHTLTMSTVQAEADVVEALSSLPTKCRHLRKLEVYAGTSSTMPPPSLSCWSEFKDVRGFSNDVRHPSDPMDWLIPLSSLPDLVDLSLSIFGSTTRKTPLETPIPLPAVTRLTLFTDSIPQCTRIFMLCRFNVLRELVVNAYCGVDRTIRDFAVSLPRSIPSTSLQSFSVFDYSNRLGNEAASVELSSLTGLLQFPNMRHIRLDVRYSLHLTDASLGLLSRAWPHLESLELNWVGHCGYEGRLCRPLPSLRGLVDLISSCSGLRTLSTVVDTSLAVQGSCLKHLFLKNPIIDYIRAFARLRSPKSPEKFDGTKSVEGGAPQQIKIGQHICTFHDTIFRCPVYAVLFSFE